MDYIHKPVDLKGTLCIHTTYYTDRICGKSVPRHRPNGWLCQYHAHVILRGEGVVYGDTP